MDRFEVEGASLATEQPLQPLRDRGFDQARFFQNRVIEWIREDDQPVAALRAPTGGGKTATFYELIEAHDMSLLVYPTNALLRQQRERFEDDGIDASVLSGDTLEGHGHERTENLIRHVNSYAANHDVVLTNPDILQAAIQAMYRGGDVMRFFDQFDAIVYDEFHFYDALAASGLLLQIKIIAERHNRPKILLASATPDEEFVTFLREKIGLDVRDIEATYSKDGDQFRKSVEVVRQEPPNLLECRNEIAKVLRQEIDDADNLRQPRVVVVFNSAKDSNDFHDFLHEEYPAVFEHTVKDNGFDTNDANVNLDDTPFYVLNTTSKGEVGLDYDIRTMFMEAPRTASDFLQRFGRAGRQSEATVHVYGLDQGPWGNNVDFQTFTEQIYRGLSADIMDHGTLSNLVGFRAALAISDREDQSGWFNQELRADFEDGIKKYGRWRGFIRTIEDECDEIQRSFEPGKYPENSPEAKLLEFTRECFHAFRGLRGRSLSTSIKYPRGDRLGLTTYDLTTTLRYYDIRGVEDDDVILLGPADTDSLSPITARLPAYETEPTRYDEPTWKIEDRLQTKIHRRIDQVELNDEFEVSTELLHQFFQLIRIVDAIVPSRITTGDYEIDVRDGNGGPPQLDIQPRDI